MNENKLSLLGAWLPYASLLITIAAFGAGAPAKLAHYRAARPIVAESDLRNEPILFTTGYETRSWRRFNEMNFHTMLAFK